MHVQTSKDNFRENESYETWFAIPKYHMKNSVVFFFREDENFRQNILPMNKAKK